METCSASTAARRLGWSPHRLRAALPELRQGGRLRVPVAWLEALPHPAPLPALPRIPQPTPDPVVAPCWTRWVALSLPRDRFQPWWTDLVTLARRLQRRRLPPEAGAREVAWLWQHHAQAIPACGWIATIRALPIMAAQPPARWQDRVWRTQWAPLPPKGAEAHGRGTGRDGPL